MHTVLVHKRKTFFTVPPPSKHFWASQNINNPFLEATKKVMELQILFSQFGANCVVNTFFSRLQRRCSCQKSVFTVPPPSKHFWASQYINNPFLEATEKFIIINLLSYYKYYQITVLQLYSISVHSIGIIILNYLYYHRSLVYSISVIVSVLLYYIIFIIIVFIVSVLLYNIIFFIIIVL